MRDFAWQEGYGILTVSRSQSDKLKSYILNQEEHHKTVTFEEEFVALLKAHHIQYDERYFWK